MSDEDTTIELAGLERLVRALKVEPPTIKVGVLSDKSTRNSAGPSNAEIGAAHEFGTSKLPMRSFLRMPLAMKLGKEMESSGALDEDVLADVIKTGSLLGWCKKIAALSEGIVLDAFDSGGFGQWRPSDMRFKKVQQTLVETHQLRDSISSEVKGGG